MYPRGANGAAQAETDARPLGDLLRGNSDPRDALKAYEAARAAPAARVVRTNREHPPDFINIKVDQLTGGKPFRHIDDVISQEELRRISEDYKKIAGFSTGALKAE
jgi:2-polyprenyl-6-methoxyphenol hydroxylase-like FAD-dependent oxidoreductase